MLKDIALNKETIDYIQSLFLDYKAKQDILNSVFEGHKYDTDSSVIESVPFKHYEKEFAKAKFAFDTCMNNVQEEYIPDDLKGKVSYWEVVFDDGVLRLTVNEA